MKPDEQYLKDADNLTASVPFVEPVDLDLVGFDFDPDEYSELLTAEQVEFLRLEDLRMRRLFRSVDPIHWQRADDGVRRVYGSLVAAAPQFILHVASPLEATMALALAPILHAEICGSAADGDACALIAAAPSSLVMALTRQIRDQTDGRGAPISTEWSSTSPRRRWAEIEKSVEEALGDDVSGALESFAFDELCTTVAWSIIGRVWEALPPEFDSWNEVDTDMMLEKAAFVAAAEHLGLQLPGWREFAALARVTPWFWLSPGFAVVSERPRSLVVNRDGFLHTAEWSNGWSF